MSAGLTPAEPAGHDRPVEAARRPSGPADASITDRSILQLAAWTALCLGTAEVALLAVAHFVLGRYTHVNPQNIWMTPLWYLVAGLVVCSLVLVAWRTRGRSRSVVALFVTTWLGTIGVLLLATRVHRVAVVLLAAGIALQYARLLTRHAFLRRAVQFTGMACVLVMPLGFAAVNAKPMSRGRASSAAAVTSGGKPNVLLIILDTVRAASMSLYGNERENTPALEALAARGVVFENAFSTASWTLPSHAGIMTGRLPHETTADWTRPLDAGPPTLAEVLRERGYRTAGFVANTYYTSRESGLDRGFSHYDDYPVWSPAYFLMASTVARALVENPIYRRLTGAHDIPGRRNAENIVSSFLEWRGRQDGAAPYFAFLNLFDAHAPYLPPAPFDTMFGPRLPGRTPIQEQGRDFAPAELRAEIDAYEAAIAYIDRELGILLDSLARRGELDHTLVIITSDHGEEFGGHGLFTHGHSLYDDVLRVPLLMSLPGRVPVARVDDWVSLRDIAATILDVMELGRDVPGESLARAWNATGRFPPDTLLAAVSRAPGLPAAYPVSRADLQAVLANPYKLIVNDGVEELYDLRPDADPAEKQNLLGRGNGGDVHARLKGWLHRILQTRSDR